MNYLLLILLTITVGVVMDINFCIVSTDKTDYALGENITVFWSFTFYLCSTPSEIVIVERGKRVSEENILMSTNITEYQNIYENNPYTGSRTIGINVFNVAKKSNESNVERWLLKVGSYDAYFADHKTHSTYKFYSIMSPPAHFTVSYGSKDPYTIKLISKIQNPQTNQSGKDRHDKFGDIDFYFKNLRSGKARDWIGIYNLSASNITSPLLWLYTCGSQNCSSPNLDFGIVTFEGKLLEDGNTAYPLQPGYYIAYYFEDGTYRILAETEIFHICC